MAHFEHDWRDERTYATASAALAKAGITLKSAKAGNPSASDLLADRNQLRQLTNTLRDTAVAASTRGDSKAADAAIDEMEAVATWVRRTQNQLDILDQTPTAARAAADQELTVDGKAVKVLRNAGDIRSHFAGKQEDRKHITAGEFLRGVAGFKLTEDVRNALSVGTDSAGGYNVPSEVLSTILEALVPASSVLSAGAGLLPLDTGAKTFTMAAVNAVPTAAWRNEGAAIAESDPTFRAVVATPRSLAFYFRISRELLADADGLDQALVQAIAQSFARELDRTALRGTGTAPEPRGILNTVGIQAVTNGAAGALLSAIKWSNMLDAYKAIIAADAPAPTAAIMAPRTLTGMAALADSTGQPLRRPGLLDPLRFIASSQVPINLTVGASTDCSEVYIADFTKLLFAMRESLSIQRLNEAFATTGQVAFVGHVRADVMLTYPTAFAVATGVRS